MDEGTSMTTKFAPTSTLHAPPPPLRPRLLPLLLDVVLVIVLGFIHFLAPAFGQSHTLGYPTISLAPPTVHARLALDPPGLLPTIGANLGFLLGLVATTYELRRRGAAVDGSQRTTRTRRRIGREVLDLACDAALPLFLAHVLVYGWGVGCVVGVGAAATLVALRRTQGKGSDGRAEGKKGGRKGPVKPTPSAVIDN